jgi:hypothetical protein
MLLPVIQARNLIRNILNIFHHLFKRDGRKKMKIKKEIQEYPN